MERMQTSRVQTVTSSQYLKSLPEPNVHPVILMMTRMKDHREISAATAITKSSGRTHHFSIMT